MTTDLSILARACWALDARRWLLTAAQVAAALLFVLGCLLFYRPHFYVHGVSLFLGGSLLILTAALGEALLRHGPSR
ncbi:MAG TPA: YrhK family protein [Acidimicrobiia bacterium]